MPLTREQLTEMGKSIASGLEAVKQGKADLAVAKKAGLDVTDIEKELNENAAKLRRIQVAYNPPMPKGK